MREFALIVTESSGAELIFPLIEVAVSVVASVNVRPVDPRSSELAENTSRLATSVVPPKVMLPKSAVRLKSWPPPFTSAEKVISPPPVPVVIVVLLLSVTTPVTVKLPPDVV